MGPMTLQPGFRFHPTDDELVGYYLKRRVDGQAIELEVIPVIDLYKFDPWELPEKSFLPKRDMEWFFFCPRDKKYPNGSRTNRATASGYWKATGKDRKVFCESSVQGLRKTLVFYCGRAPGGERTDWVMHEYRLCEDLTQPIPNFLGGFALCRVVKRNEQGLKVGDSFGESKGKRSFPSVDTDCRPRKNFSKGKTSAEVYSPQANSLFEICSELQPTAAVTDQTSFWESQYLCDVPENINSLDKSFLPESCPSKSISPFLNSNASCPSSSISPVSSYASCTEEELNPNGYFSPFMNLLPHANVFGNENEMGFQGFEWEMPSYLNPNTNGFDAGSNMLSPLICRQASDCEDTGLWFQDDSLLVVM